ncbi:MAG: hypothetical protein IPK13_12440 [Deltaproteobacteria bacterium]|nr:hypothetical protein [Deltaproteobacteria bacterium]
MSPMESRLAKRSSSVFWPLSRRRAPEFQALQLRERCAGLADARPDEREKSEFRATADRCDKLHVRADAMAGGARAILRRVGDAIKPANPEFRWLAQWIFDRACLAFGTPEHAREAALRYACSELEGVQDGVLRGKLEGLDGIERALLAIAGPTATALGIAYASAGAPEAHDALRRVRLDVDVVTRLETAAHRLDKPWSERLAGPFESYTVTRPRRPRVDARAPEIRTTEQRKEAAALMPPQPVGVLGRVLQTLRWEGAPRVVSSLGIEYCSPTSRQEFECLGHLIAGVRKRQAAYERFEAFAPRLSEFERLLGDIAAGPDFDRFLECFYGDFYNLRIVLDGLCDPASLADPAAALELSGQSLGRAMGSWTAWLEAMQKARSVYAQSLLEVSAAALTRR